MTRNPFSSLRFKLVLLVLLAVVPALAVMVGAAREQRALAAREAQEQGLRLARLAAARQSQLVGAAKETLSTLARQPALMGTDPAPANALLADLRAGSTHFANLVVVRPDGELFASGIPFTGSINVSEMAFFRRPMETGRFAVGGYQVGAVTGKATLDFGLPVKGPGGEIRGIVAAAMELSWVSEMAARGQLPEETTLLVLDERGVVLGRHPEPEGWLGREVPVGALAGRREGMGEETGPAGEQRLMAFTPLSEEGGGWVVVSTRRTAALAEADRGFLRGVALVGVLGAVALVAAWIGARLFVMRRLDALVSAAGRLGSGDLTARTGLPEGSDEIADVARSFDRMADELQRRTEERRRAMEQVARLAAIVECSDDAIVGLDPQGHVATWNSGAQRIYGHAEGDLKGKPASLLVPLGSADDLPRLLERLAAGERIDHLDTVHVRKNGETFAASLTLSAIRDAEGRMTGASMVARDMSARQRDEDALRRSRERYEALVHAVDGIVWEADARTFQLTFISRRAESILGLAPERLTGDREAWRSTVHEEDRERLFETWERAVRENRPQECTFRAVAADGRIVWLRDLVAPVVEFDEPVALRGILRPTAEGAPVGS